MKRIRDRLCTCLPGVIAGVLTLWPVSCEAQISPPGLGVAQAASWSALGLRQDLDAVHRRVSMTYLGMGTISDRDDENPFDKPAIVVMNQEIYDRFRPYALASLALSYRRQNLYEADPPYARAHPAHRQELRLYGRLAHVFDAGQVKLATTFRPELRTFWGPGLKREAEALELRLRLKTQATWTLDRDEVHRLVAGAELLAAIARDRARAFSGLDYRETRFCLYYSLHPHGAPIAIDIGYMSDLLGSGASLTDVHYLAVDLVWSNPFGAP